jgi:diphthamide biosynthesis protein 7
MGTVTTQHEVRLDLHADVADWNPNPGKERLLAVGTYELDEATQVRHGMMTTYAVQGSLAAGATSTTLEPADERPSCTSLEVRGTLKNLPGIFDLQFIPGSLCGSQTMVATALADGSVRLLDALPEGNDSGRSVPICSSTSGDKEYWDPSVMALTVDSLGFSQEEGCACQGSSPASFSCCSSYSDGSIKLFEASPDGKLRGIRRWEAHSLEAWMATWSRAPGTKGKVVFSGGDDAVFQAWDVRSTEESPIRMFLDRKTHQAGVCCVTEVPGTETMVLTGSYDNHVRVWDWRYTSRPLLRASLDAGGGVWRLKTHPKDHTLILAACMHEGFKVFKIDGEGEAVEVAERVHYPHQRTLAYGASWCRDKDLNGLIATCSFYDNLMHIWNIDTSSC